MPEEESQTIVGPYAQSAWDYRKLGWADVLPLPAGKKSHPPTGYTGKRFAHVSPDPSEIDTWINTKGDGNIALRMPANILGIDVDAYGDKTGLESLTQAIASFGPLPETWRVTSRDDGISGIRFYKIPEGLQWPNQIGPGIETIHRGHRYAVVWPSLHPEGRTYRWIDPDNRNNIGAGPVVDSLPELPMTWVHGLTKGQLATPATERLDTNAEELAVAFAEWCTPGVPCALVNRKLYDMEDALSGRQGSRHDAVRDLMLGLLRLGQTGHSGVGYSLQRVGNDFVQVIGNDRGITSAELEWKRMLLGGISIILAKMQPREQCNGKDCDGKLKGLEFSVEEFLAPVSDPGQQPASLDDDEEVSIYADLGWLLTGKAPEIDPPSWVVRADGHSLFYPGRINGIFGDPETAKSWLAMCAVVEALLQKRRAVYLDVDHNGSAEIATRLVALGAPIAYIANPNFFRIAEPEDIQGLRTFIQDMIQWKPDIAVVDSLGEIVPMLGLKSTDNDDITKAIRAVCKPLAHVVGACVITIDHLPKGVDARSSGYAIGGTAKKRAVDGTYLSAEVLMAPAPGKLGKIGLSIEKDRNGGLRSVSPGKHAGTFVLDSSDPSRTLWRIEMPSLSADGKMRPTILMERVTRFVADWPEDENPSRNEVIKGVKGKDSAVNLAIDILVQELYLAETRDGESRNSPRRLGFVKHYDSHLDPLSDTFQGGFSQPEHKAPPAPPSSSQLLLGGASD